eukprot:TRINITY_DN2795_c0_g1_i3.p1 TRINITY_DN2795_c0_g1~~TRINITY_DN2795_c0_g1_i3.p1  ORF type:complete len:1418 (-),score=317.02 TRINITY_DN2795_c0_g1_i3:83-4336(-)
MKFTLALCVLAVCVSGWAEGQILGPQQTFSATVPSTVQRLAPTVNQYTSCIDLQPYAVNQPSVRMYWSIDSVNNAVNIMMRSQVACPTCGYVSVGLYPSTYAPFDGGHQYGTGSNAFVDLWAASSSTNVSANCYPWCINDAYMAPGRPYRPIRDAKDNLYNKILSYSNGMIYAQFTRPFITGDNFYDQNMTATNEFWLVYSCNPYFNMDNNIPEHYYDQGSNTWCSGSSDNVVNFSLNSTAVQACNVSNDLPPQTFTVQNMGVQQTTSTIVGVAPKTLGYDNCLQLTGAADPHNIYLRWTVSKDNASINFMLQGLVAQNYMVTGEAGYVGVGLYPYGTMYPPYGGGHPDQMIPSTDNFTDLWAASASMFNGSRCFPFCIDDAYMIGYQPANDVFSAGTDDITGKNVMIDNSGNLYAMFTRAVATPDTTYDQQIDINKQYTLLYSCSPYQSLSYAVPEHQVSNTGAARCAGMKTMTFSQNYQCTTTTPTGTTYTSPNKDFFVSWSVASGMITFTMSSIGVGWLGIGFSAVTVPPHTGSDMVVAWVDSAGAVQIIDGFSSKQTQPTYDVQQDATAISSMKTTTGGLSSATGLTIQWSRKLDTGDATNDYVISNAPLTFAWAYHTDLPTGTGSNAQYMYHGASRDNTFLNFVGGGGPVAGQTYTSGKFSATWQISGTSITFNMSGQAVGWISVGFSAAGVDAHKGSDMIVGWVDTTGAVQIIDGFSSSQSQPTYDEQQDAIPISGTVSGGQIAIVFTRALNTGDVNDYAITNNPLTFAWALHTTAVPTGTAATAMYTFHTDYDEVVLNLFTGGVVLILVKMTPALSLSIVVSALILAYSIVRFGWKLLKYFSTNKAVQQDEHEVPDQDPLKDIKSSRNGKFLRGSMAVDYANPAKEALKQPDNEEDDENEDAHGEDPHDSPDLPPKESGELKENVEFSPSKRSSDGRRSKTKNYGQFSPDMYTKLKEKSSGNKGANFFARITKARLPFKGVQIAVVDLVGFGIYLFINLGYVIWWPLQGYTPDITWGYLAVANAFFVALPATRNSVLVYLLGAPFDKTIQFHRWLGYLCLVESSLHWAYYFPYTLLYEKCITGLTSWIFVFLVFLTSVDKMRRFYFNTFYTLHFLFLGFYIGGVGHTKEFVPYAALALILYGMDRIVRFFLGAVPKRTLRINVHEGAVKINFSKNAFGSYALGQYVFLNFPEIGLLEWHPFTLSSGPAEPTCEVMVKGLGDHTKKLVQASAEKGKLWIRVDGPYGKWPFNIMRYRTVILVSGGVGVTPCMAALRHIYHINREDKLGDSRLKSVFFVWSCKDASDFHWYGDVLESIVHLSESVANYPKLHNHSHITSARESDPLPALAKPGRPRLEKIFEAAENAAKKGEEARIAVIACGPESLVNLTWDETSKRTQDRNRFDFHHETFEF